LAQIREFIFRQVPYLEFSDETPLSFYGSAGSSSTQQPIANGIKTEALNPKKFVAAIEFRVQYDAMDIMPLRLCRPQRHRGLPSNE
jgi:hypothetical protein